MEIADLLTITAMTEESFAPYGKLLGRPNRPSDIEKETLSYWHQLDDVAFTDHPVWGFLEVRNRPAMFDQLERHCGAHEVFIPVGSDVSVMPFALGGDPDDPDACPDPSTITCFLVDGSQAFVVPRGVWHTPAFPLGEAASFLLALEKATPENDIDLRTVGPYRIAL